MMELVDIDLRNLIGPDVLDQGTRPTCVPFAASAAHEAARTHTGAAAEHLSPEAIWAYCMQHGTATAEGMILNDAGLALTDDGQPLLDKWPYDKRATVRPETAGIPPWHRADLTELHLHHDGVEANIEDALVGGQPVILVLEVTDEFLLTGDDGIIDVPNVRVRHGGYHAVTCVGAATHPSAGRLLLIKNSWGDEWGVGGYGWLPIDYLRAFAAQAAVIHAREGA